MQPVFGVGQAFQVRAPRQAALSRIAAPQRNQRVPPWLLVELDAVEPQILVCLGASAAKSLLGAKFALTRDRGKVVSSAYAQQVVATLHPSAILRATDAQRAGAMRQTLLDDPRVARALVA